jgi:hypothetical protein
MQQLLVRPQTVMMTESTCLQRLKSSTAYYRFRSVLPSDCLSATSIDVQVCCPLCSRLFLVTHSGELYNAVSHQFMTLLLIKLPVALLQCTLSVYTAVK